MFFFTWYRSVVNLMSVDAWACLSLVSLALVIVLLLVYLFSERVWLRKIGFFGGVVLLILFVLGNVFAPLAQLSCSSVAITLVYRGARTGSKTSVKYLSLYVRAEYWLLVWA